MESKSFIRKIISNPIIQTLAVYVSGGWILIELLEYFIAHFNLNEQFRNIFLIALLCGLPVALIVAWLVSRDKKVVDEKRPEADAKLSGTSSKLFRKPAVIIPGLVIITLAVVFGIRYINRSTKIKWAKEVAFPEIEKLRNEMKYAEAFSLYQKAEKFISEDTEFIELASRVTARITILTDPPGAEVSIREYTDVEGNWGSVGETPIDSIKLPRLFYVINIEKEGYENVQGVLISPPDTFTENYLR